MNKNIVNLFRILLPISAIVWIALFAIATAELLYGNPWLLISVTIAYISTGLFMWFAVGAKLMEWGGRSFWESVKNSMLLLVVIWPVILYRVYFEEDEE